MDWAREQLQCRRNESNLNYRSLWQESSLYSIQSYLVYVFVIVLPGLVDVRLCVVVDGIVDVVTNEVTSMVVPATVALSSCSISLKEI